jgi:haloalkane dehalogenase
MTNRSDRYIQESEDAMTTLTASAATDLFRREPDDFLDVGAGHAAYRRIGTGLDFPGAGSSRFGNDTVLSLAQHITTVRRVIDILGLASVAVVGHDSGGMIARHAVVGDPRLRALGLVNTEQPQGLTWRFKSFLAVRHLPGAGHGLGWVMGRPGLRRSPLVLGAAFTDRSVLAAGGEFDELFLRPIHEIPARRDAAIRVLRSFDPRHVHDLGAIHRRIEAPVQLVWGDKDPFFPVERAREMVGTFPHARLTEIPGAGLFCHEERPAEVAAALLPVLAGS